MGTPVAIEVVAAGADEAVARAYAWFREIEACCSRFDPSSELRRLADRPGEPVEVSPMLFEAVQFALAVAEETGGAFDPTVGRQMETQGLDRQYSTGAVSRTPIDARAPVSFRDVRLDPERRTVSLLRPLLLDLGAVAKGLAVDMAARELAPFADFAIDAGGDLYLSGHNAAGELWSVGIRHPRLYDQMIETIRVSNKAVCTSGDYERLDAEGARLPHILDPRTRESTAGAASVTVVAPTAMLADALATAAFVLGPERGVALLERSGIEGVIFTPAMSRHQTAGFARA